jgi:hypothetical protein
MQISEFKGFADSLGRFASIKERKEPGPKNTTTHRHKPHVISSDAAHPERPLLYACSKPDNRGKRCSKMWRAEELNMQFDPTDSILVQAVGGQLKLVAGTHESTLIVSAGPTEAKGKALVDARLFLNAAKSLRGKGEVTFLVSPEGATIKVSTGGEVTLPNVSTVLPDWLKPTTTHTGDAQFRAKFWPEASKVITATTGDYWPFSHVHIATDRELVRLTSTDGVACATTLLSGEDDLIPIGPIGSISSVFTAALKNLDESGDIQWDADTLTVTAGPYKAVTQLYRAYTAIAKAESLMTESVTFVDVDRKVLTDMVRGVASNDEFNRVALAARDASLTVHPYDNRAASVKVPASVAGQATTVGVDAAVLSRCLTASPGKTVSLGWSPSGTPIQFLDKDWPWRMFLAPVTT